MCIRDRFSPGPGVDYLLDLLSRMSKDSGVTTRDNGVSQEVEARQGVALKALGQVKPRVALRPFRTFLEVEQPVSELLLRLDDDGNVGLFEADGGMWPVSYTHLSRPLRRFRRRRSSLAALCAEWVGRSPPSRRTCPASHRAVLYFSS